VAAKAHKRTVNGEKAGGMRNDLLAQYRAERCLMSYRQSTAMLGFGIAIETPKPARAKRDACDRGGIEPETELLWRQAGHPPRGVE
jgi:hypothetical protein